MIGFFEGLPGRNMMGIASLTAIYSEFDFENLEVKLIRNTAELSEVVQKNRAVTLNLFKLYTQSGYPECWREIKLFLLEAWNEIYSAETRKNVNKHIFLVRGERTCTRKSTVILTCQSLRRWEIRQTSNPTVAITKQATRTTKWTITTLRLIARCGDRTHVS